MEKPGFWERLKGWRTMGVAIIAGGLSAAFGALSFMDWTEPVRELFPSLPGWVIILLAAFIGGALRVITTTPMGEKQP